MVYGLWQSAGGLLAEEYRQTVLANNLANAETPGFKPDRVSFQQRLNAAAARGERAAQPTLFDRISGGVFEADVHTNFAEGPIVPSDSPFDVAIHGDGFLTVNASDGPRYTRDGRMTLDKSGTLVHAASGQPVLTGEGQRIVVNTGSRDPVKIDSGGRVIQGEYVLGRLGLAAFSDPQQLDKVGGNLFAAGEAVPTESRAEIRQRSYEASGVQPVSALVEMIAASRAYQLNATLITLQDQSLGRVVNDLGRIG